MASLTPSNYGSLPTEAAPTAIAVVAAAKAATVNSQQQSVVVVWAPECCRCDTSIDVYYEFGSRS